MAKSDNGDINNRSSPSTPSDPNNSFIKKVTSRVSGFIPSSLSKWFGEANQSVVRRREPDEDEDEDQPGTQLPPRKRARMPPEVDFSSSERFTITSTPLPHSHSESWRSQPGPSGYGRDNATITSQQYDQATVADVHINGDDKSDSGESTSGYSSAPVTTNKESSSPVKREIPAETSTFGTKRKLSPPKQTSPRSLFSDQSLTQNKSCLRSKRPAFNASVFGSPSFMDRTLSTKRAVNSPFYSGRTIYGGASAYTKTRTIFPRDDKNSISVKNSIEMKPNNDKNTDARKDTVNLSITARKILNALEHFSSPVQDARKIPSVIRPQEQKDQNKIGKRTPYSRENTIINKASKNEMLIPTIPDLLKMKMKERLQTTTESVKKVATTSKSVLNSGYTMPTNEKAEEKPRAHINKIKSKVVSVREHKKDVESEPVEEVHLPDVQLPITTLPKFDFSLPPPPAALSKTTTPIIKSPIEKPQITNNTSSDQYKFASPITLNDMIIPKTVISVNNFKFSQPLNARKNNFSSVTMTTEPPLTFKSPERNSTAPRRRDTPKNNGQNPEFSFSVTPAPQLVSGSVMDVLGNKPETKSDLAEKFKPAAGTWECATCMVRNIPSATRCIACETLKEPPKKSGNDSSPKWECKVCLIRNNSTDNKCVACTNPKPGTASTQTIPPIAPAVTSNFGDKFKPPSDTWECTTCMVRNKNDAMKCIACETAKPGTKTLNKSTLVMPPDLKQATSGFGDLIKKQVSEWECSSCLVRNSPDKKQCVCCETPKPGLKPEFTKMTSTATGFKFGIDKNDDKGFTFGIPSDKPNATFAFGVKPASTELPKTVEKTLPKESINSTSSSGSSTIVTTAPSGFTFGIPTKSSEDVAKKSEVPKEAVVEKYEVRDDDNKKSEPVSAPMFNFASPSTTSKMPMFVGTNTSMASTTPISASFSFGSSFTSVNSSTVSSNLSSQNKPTFSFSSVVASTIPAAVAKPNNTSYEISKNAETTKHVFANTGASIVTTSVATMTSAVFTFGSSSAQPTTQTTEKSKPAATFPVPQFNFGGNLPFNPKPESVPSSTITTPVPPGPQPPPAVATFNFGSNLAPSKPAFGTNFTSNSVKTDVKPFSFGSNTGEPPIKAPAFSFKTTSETITQPAAPMFSFGASNAGSAAPTPIAASTAPSSSMFNFTASKADSPVFGGNTGSSVFNPPVQTAPQNGGFNFSASAAPNFKFGSGTNTSTPAVFGFGSSQAGTGSAAPGAFTFGSNAPTTFSPDVRPNFNFTGGSTPSFTAQGTAAPTAAPVRKTRKAIRRSQPR